MKQYTARIGHPGPLPEFERMKFQPTQPVACKAKTVSTREGRMVRRPHCRAGQPQNLPPPGQWSASTSGARRSSSTPAAFTCPNRATAAATLTRSKPHSRPLPAPRRAAEEVVACLTSRAAVSVSNTRTRLPALVRKHDRTRPAPGRRRAQGHGEVAQPDLIGADDRSRVVEPGEGVDNEPVGADGILLGLPP